MAKSPLANAGDIRDAGSTPGWGRFPGEGNGSPLQYSCLENPMDRRAWWATAHGVAKSRTRLSNFMFKHLIVLCLVTQSCPTLQAHGQRSLVGYSPLGFSRQEYWSGLPCPPPGDLLNPGIKPMSPTLQADSSPSEPPGKPKHLITHGLYV